jgi:hypothetical protein
MMFRITEEWIETYTTAGGAGINRSQVAAIGEAWPAQKGWKNRLVGKLITEGQRELFESMKGRKINKRGEITLGRPEQADGRMELLGMEHSTLRKPKQPKEFKSVPKVFDESYDDGLGVPFEEGKFFMGKRVESVATVNPMPSTKGKSVNAIEFLNIGLPTAIEKKLDAAGVNGEVAGLAIKVCHLASLMSDYPIGHHLWMYHNRQRMEQLRKLSECLLLSDAFDWGWANPNGKTAMILVTPHGVACWQSSTRFAGPVYDGSIPKKFSNAPIIVKWVEEILSWENALAS